MKESDLRPSRYQRDALTTELSHYGLLLITTKLVLPPSQKFDAGNKQSLLLRGEGRELNTRQRGHNPLLYR